jgi:putative ABC transport system permease protein
MFGVFSRGIKNTFRNIPRTISVVFILAISIGLALVMLLSYISVQNKITSIKHSIGNIITLTPAGINGFEGGGQPLTNEQMQTVSTISHVVSVSSIVTDRLSTGSGSTTGATTSLQSAITPGSFGTRQRNFAFFSNRGGGQAFSPPANFSLPIVVTGVNDPTQFTTNGWKLTSGSSFTGSSTADVAVLGTSIASKNSLSVGSTFTAYNTTIKVVGIYDSGTTFTNNGVYFPLLTLQTLSGQTDSVTSTTVTVDSISNMNDVVSTIKSKLGSSNVDIVTTQDQAQQTLAPLVDIANISLYSLIGALLAGSIITLLTMVMIVRERKKEIGVLKAIGASSFSIVMQFMSEALVLTLMGMVVGTICGLLLSNSVLSVLVNSVKQTATTTTSAAPGGFGGGGFGARIGGGARLFNQAGQGISSGLRSSLTALHTSVSLSIILYAIAAALIIAIIGSAFPAWLISRIKPAEVIRSE